MTPTVQNAGLLVARILLGAMFILAGFGKLGDVQGFAGYMASGGVPGFLAWPVILLEIFGGLALLIGFQTRLAALALGVFSVAAGVLYHFVPADQMQMTIFMKNLALGGGYLALALAGPAAWSVDAALSRRSIPAAA
ncbi:DoxX family protein [Marinovum sp.]|uniref:DoxX family protein n=1 Tax=Marinovum sp. TaxID=2024839 RepID=UPI002B26A842|nr:DoxX family protein [Marinovum sp.]